MILAVLILCFLFFALVGWGSRQRLFQRGDWRVGAGFFGIAVLFAGLVFGVRGEPLPAAGLVALSGVLIALARKRRAAARPAPAAPPRGSGRLSEADARAILGVDPDAGPAEIRAAYARLIRTLHPDAGGSSVLAAQLNAARDRLLKG